LRSRDQRPRRRSHRQFIKGFPVASSSTVDVGTLKITSSSKVTEERHTAIPESTWEAPAGFAKVENPMMRAS
jgi:hypothetical protein